MKRPTQLDVAKKAGVSRATVSLIINDQLNGNVRISPETIQRVKSVVAELGYQPNGVAQSLRRQRTNLLALLVPDITNPYYPMLIRGAQAVADAHDYQLLIYDSDDSAEKERTFIETMLRRRVDGVMMVSFHLKEADIKRLVNAGIKVALSGSASRMANLPVSATYQDHSGAIKALIKHLIDTGHKRIAHIAGPQDTPPGLQRLLMYREALAEHGIEYDPSFVKIGTFRQEGITEIIQDLIVDRPQSERPTAIFAANDVMALEAIYTLRSLDITIPDEVAVCGFDDIPQSAWIRPSLTTIGQNPYEQGKQAATLLVERLVGKDLEPPKNAVVPYQLVIRDST